MSRIRSKGSLIEKKLACELRRKKISFRRHSKQVFGKPDFIIAKKKIAIFCDSAFWHGYKKLNSKRHAFKSNREFWINKIKRNIMRDRMVNRTLKKDGWVVLRFWDFEINKNCHLCIEKVVDELR